MRDVSHGLFGRSRSSDQAPPPDADEPFGSFLACPVAVDETRADVAADVAALPVSRPPVSQLPVSRPPVSQLPVSQPPVSQALVSQPPVGQPPVSRPPVGQPPVSQALVSRAPVSRAPVSRAPVSRALVSWPAVSRPPVSRLPVSRPPVSRPPEDAGSAAYYRLLASAEQFIRQFYGENVAGDPGARLWHVRREIEATGTYVHTEAELEFGARVAWRNSARCIGRLYWHSLRVRDRRGVTSARGIAAESAAHLREATNGGRIRPVITIFAPDAPGRPGPRILSPQLVQYAVYLAPDGTLIGDPASAGITRVARHLGWPGRRPAGRFDVLPMVIQGVGAAPTLHELPAGAVLEVPIEHPYYRWFAHLGLRWHAVPVISDMYLEIGGIRYPAAPFNGWYMGTEIGSRDLGDVSRYNQLPAIARHMGLSTASDRTLWKDKAVTELNLAVLHSFASAGVTITDHHTESARFLQHLRREERHGRACPADWTWIVPPAASSATPVFHRTYRDFDQSPNFYRHPAPRLSAIQKQIRALAAWSARVS
jgi:nitric-oxide synthase